MALEDGLRAGSSAAEDCSSTLLCGECASALPCVMFLMPCVMFLGSLLLLLLLCVCVLWSLYVGCVCVCADKPMYIDVIWRQQAYMMGSFISCS